MSDTRQLRRLRNRARDTIDKLVTVLERLRAEAVQHDAIGVSVQFYDAAIRFLRSPRDDAELARTLYVIPQLCKCLPEVREVVKATTGAGVGERAEEMLRWLQLKQVAADISRHASGHPENPHAQRLQALAAELAASTSDDCELVCRVDSAVRDFEAAGGFA